jgi:hypothetical protein
MNAYIKNIDRSQINDLLLQLKVLEKQEQAKPKASWREIIKIRAKKKKNLCRDQKNYTKNQENRKLVF